MDELIAESTSFLQGKIRFTPIEFSPQLTQLQGQPVYLKLECLQETGSFKVRGALFYLSTLTPEEQKRGVAVCSAGNHGLGVAYGAKQMCIPCIVYAPKGIDQAKHDKLLALGAVIKLSPFHGYDDTLQWAMEELSTLQLPLIPAYNDEKIMASNGGTLAVEVLSQVPEANHFVLPIGGGGISAGFAWHVKSKNPQARVIACQLAKSAALKLSLERGRAVTYMPAIDTLAGGLEGGLGEKCFEILKHRLDQMALIEERELKSAIRWFLEHHQYLIEPSAAVTLAGCLYGHVQLTGPTVIVLTGRNVCYATLKAIIGGDG